MPFKTALVDRARRQQDSASYRAVNPTGLIPALETPAGALFETAAILLWLSETHGSLAPPCPARRTGAPSSSGCSSPRTPMHADIRMHFYYDRFAGSPEAEPAFRAATQTRILHHLSLVEEMAATRPAWCNPERPSMLTWYLCCLIRWLALYPTDRQGWFDLTAFPSLRALAAAHETLPATRRAALAEGLGDKVFTRPSYARPPEGSAT